MTAAPGRQKKSGKTIFRVLIGSFGLVVVAVGWFGMHDYVIRTNTGSSGVLDVFYDVLQLFVMGSDPLQGGDHFPPSLEFARFGAAAFTVLAVIEAVRVLLESKIRGVRARRARGHVVVCGDTTVARTLVDRLHAAGELVAMVYPQPNGGTEMRGRRLLDVIGDATDHAVLHSVGISRARAVYVATGDSTANVSVALAATQLLPQRTPPVAVYAQIHDSDFCLSLQARRLSLATAGTHRLDFFNVDDLAARVVFVREPLSPVDGAPPRLLIAGGSPLARAVLVEAARQWRLDPRRTGRLTVTWVADEATTSLAVIQNRYPFVPEACEATAFDVPLPMLLSADLWTEPHDRAFLCYADEAQALKIALTTARLWEGGFRSVVVPLNRLSGLATAFHPDGARPLLDGLHHALRLYPVVEAACDPALIAEDLIERLAQLIHEQYVAARRRGGDTGSSGALAGWAHLDDERRWANRAQAADFGHKLDLINCMIVPRNGTVPQFSFTDDEIDRLARWEHQRWVRDLRNRGWRYGLERDDAGLFTPDMVDWSELSEASRGKNRSAVLDMPDILAQAGFDIVRASAPEPELAGEPVRFS